MSTSTGAGTAAAGNAPEAPRHAVADNADVLEDAVPAEEVATSTTVAPSLGGAARTYVAKIRGGDMGALPAVLGILVLCTVFTAVDPVFFSPGNFANLFAQGATITVIAMGLVFVLLLGEIDLSAGVTSGVCAAVLAVLLTERGYAMPVALLAALVTGLVIGTAIGALVSYVGIPSFVVTLAAFLAFQGVVLIVIGEGGNVSIRDETILSVANDNLSPALGWLLVLLAVGGYAAVQVLRATGRRRKGLAAEPWSLVGLRIGTLALLAGAAVAVLNQERSINIVVTSLKGVPLVVPLILVLFVLLSFVLDRTTYGRHVYAVGGNAEAARRAGIQVKRIRMSVFMIASTLAAVGGIIAASRANSVDPNAGGSNTLLYAVGAAVIGGTSLFGGRGRVRDAILGGAVVAIIDNGMGLLGYTSGTKFVVTGVVLLIAAGVDALSRKRAAASGRA